jgi:hypothetical protein
MFNVFSQLPDPVGSVFKADTSCRHDLLNAAIGYFG